MEQQNNQVQEFEVEIDIREVVIALLQKWYLIALAGILTAALFLGYSKYLVPEKFESNTSIYILNQSEEELSYSDFQMGATLTKDYEVLIKSRAVLEEVAKKLKMDASYEDLKGMLSVSVPDSTRIVEITVKTTSPKQAQRIANAVREIASKKISDVMDVDAVNVVETANLPTRKCSPSVGKNTVLGGMLGGFVACVIILLFVMFNDKIRTQDDVEKYLGVSTLGTIPISEGTLALDKKYKEERRSKKESKKFVISKWSVNRAEYHN